MGVGVFIIMRIRAVSLVLLLVLALPLQMVSAEENDSSLEAREAQANFSPIETTFCNGKHHHVGWLVARSTQNGDL